MRVNCLSVAHKRRCRDAEFMFENLAKITTRLGEEFLFKTTDKTLNVFEILVVVLNFLCFGKP